MRTGTKLPQNSPVIVRGTRPKKRNPYLDIWQRLKRNRMAVAGLVFLILLILMAIFANWIAPYTYDGQNLNEVMQPPNWHHLLGTDEYGRDIFSRIVYGSRISLEIGFVAVAFSVILGGLIGALAGYYGGQVDNVLMRLMDIILAIPGVLLAIAIVNALGPSLVNVMIAVGIAAIPTYARVVRASVLTVRDREFVEAARAVGENDLSIIFGYIIPNCLSPIIVQVTLGVAYAILNAAGLSFLGLGLQPPTPEWGAMLSEGRQYIFNAYWLTLFPGLAIVLVVLALNMFGDGLRDALDPRLKQ